MFATIRSFDITTIFSYQGHLFSGPNFHCILDRY